MEIINIVTKDQFTLQGCIYRPTNEVVGGVIINSATAVKQSYYQNFAKFLTLHGYIVITYDYRGIGLSQPNSREEHSQLTMKAWGEYDFDAVIQWAKTNYSEISWHCIGHSVGGQLLGLASSSQLLESAYCVAAQSGYWGHWRLRDRARVLLSWYLFIPLLSKLFGKVPGVLLGGESLPAGIALEWARWCRHPDFIVTEKSVPIREHFHSLNIRMRFIAVSDDFNFAPVAAVQALATFYKKANKDYQLIDAKQIGGEGIGHFGFFKKSNKEALWGDYLDWLAQ